MEERILTEQFREAWINMDMDAISACLADNIRFLSVATSNSLDNKQDFLTHAGRIFQILRTSQALTLPETHCRKASFGLTYQFEALVPVTHYMINSEGFGFVVCLENRTVSMETLIKLRFKEQLISGIKIFQTKNIGCRKTALPD